MSENKIASDKIEKYYKNFKPIKELLKYWDPEGGEYLACTCGYIMHGKSTIDSSIIYSVVTCGKCGNQYEVIGKMVGYREYKEE